MAAKKLSRKEDIARAFGVHTNTVLNWIRAGCPHSRSGRGPYLLDRDAVQAWLQKKGLTGRPGRPTDGGGSGQLTDAKIAFTAERAMLMRLRREKEAGILHNAAECRARRLRQIQEVKGRLLALPRSLAAEIADRPRAECEKLLMERIEALIRIFAGEE